jgi:hypothetical protein
MWGLFAFKFYVHSFSIICLPVVQPISDIQNGVLSHWFLILETDCQVTYHEDEIIQDEEYESVMIYCRVPQLPWDTQLWKISVYIATRWVKIINRRPHAQSLYYRSKRRRRITLQESTIQHCEYEFTDGVMSKLRVRSDVNWRHVSHKYAEANWIHLRFVTDNTQFHCVVCHIRRLLLYSQILVASA